MAINNFGSFERVLGRVCMERVDVELLGIEDYGGKVSKSIRRSIVR